MVKDLMSCVWDRLVILFGSSCTMIPMSCGIQGSAFMMVFYIYNKTAGIPRRSIAIGWLKARSQRNINPHYEYKSKAYTHNKVCVKAVPVKYGIGFSSSGVISQPPYTFWLTSSH